ncbi:putative ER lumen protein retaining receptor [Helianthus annuus]|nr:putative ER lumen protein retaining receptor [Helianthus annuus]
MLELGIGLLLGVQIIGRIVDLIPHKVADANWATHPLSEVTNGVDHNGAENKTVTFTAVKPQLFVEDKDNFAMYYVVAPCAVLALLIHPSTSHYIINRIFWAFCVYLEAASVLPQLRVIQNTKLLNRSRVLDSHGHLLTTLGYGLWPSMVLISEVVQTFILADFCYYYVKSVFGGQLVMRLPSGVV